MALDSTGRAHWEGDLAEGSGTAVLGSGIGGPMQVTWKARSEEHAAGMTSPEELIAAAHAACFSMAFSARLGKAGASSIVLDTEATATFVPGEGITGIALTVRGTVEGIIAEEFADLAEDAKENCPVSQALKGNVPITLDASLS
jgi:osmotically inducible protein OsmC